MSVGALRLCRWRVAAALAAFLGGCFDPMRAYVAKHPSTPFRIRQAMVRGEIVPGMDKEVVRIVWGDPEKVESTGRDAESWRYTRHIPGNVGAGYFSGYIVAFRGNVVTRVHGLGRVDGW